MSGRCMETSSPVSRALSCAELFRRFSGDAGGGGSPLSTETEKSSTLGGSGTERQGDAGGACVLRRGCSSWSTRCSQASRR